MEKISTTFAHNLASLRKERKLSQVDLASLCGWDTQSRISNYETNFRTPDLDDIEILAKALNIDVLELLTPANGVREARPSYTPPDKSQKIQEAITTLCTGHLARYFDAQPTTGKIPFIIHLYELLQSDSLRASITTLDKQTLFRLLKIES